MHVVLGRHPGGLLGLLEEGPNVYIKSQVGVGSGYYLGATVMAVLPHLGYKDAGAAPVTLGKHVGDLADLLYLRVAAEFGLVNSTHGTNDSLVSVELFL
jgi:hypothetical protein